MARNVVVIFLALKMLDGKGKHFPHNDSQQNDGSDGYEKVFHLPSHE
jgi:hypothetical protein